MEQYIPKSALVAEIEKQQRRLDILGQSDEVELRKNVAIQNGVYCSLLSFLDTFEVKEVDLCEEEEKIWKDFNIGECHLSKNDLEKIAKHFFELGLKAQKGE